MPQYTQTVPTIQHSKTMQEVCPACGGLQCLCRPRFFAGQLLTEEDLNRLEHYIIEKNKLHNRYLHGWGVVCHPCHNLVTVKSGYALSPCGEDVVVCNDETVDVCALIQQCRPRDHRFPDFLAELLRPYVYDPALDDGTPAGRLIEVWLRYDETATQNVRPGFEVCDVADQRSRVQETFRVEVGARPGHVDRHDRITVAGNGVDAQEAAQTLDPQTPPVAIYDESVPYQSFPAEGERAYWLLPLGMARWLPNSNPNQPSNFVPRNAQDLAKSRSLRRYIGVVAESVQAAEGILRLRDRTKDYSQVQSNDLVWVEGSLRVEGDARLFGGRLDFRHLDGQDFAVPLHIRRTGDPGPGARALQISLGPDDGQSNHRLAVGPLKTDNTLDEKFVVLSGGNIGIGTTAPAAKLEITADWTGEEGALRLTGDKPTIRFTGGAVAGNESWILHLGSDGPGNLQFFRRSGAATWTNVLNLSPGGNVGIGTEQPKEKLEVRGNIRFGLNSDVFAMGALQNLRVIVGRINADGTPGTGDGFTSARSEVGNYAVSFTHAFSHLPVVLASTVNSLADDNIVTIRNITVNGFEARTTDVAGTSVTATRQNTEFTFIALGNP